MTDSSDRTLHVLGVPLRSGSLVPGSEDDARGLREAGLVERLREAGCEVVDEGDVAIPSYLPHHTIPPIRSWPGPRIAWECVAERVAPLLERDGHIPVLIGCDCSVVASTAQALLRVAEEVHVVYVDGDYDDAPPDAGRCNSAAAMAVWLLARGAPFRDGPSLDPARITVLGATTPALSDLPGLRAVPLDDLRRVGAASAARRVLEAIPPSAAILLHFDTDAIRRGDFPAAYFPHEEGLSRDEAAALLGVVLADRRVRLVEVSEYAWLRDADGSSARLIVDLLVGGLGR